MAKKADIEAKRRFYKELDKIADRVIKQDRKILDKLAKM